MSKLALRSANDLHPAHALLTPTWLGALAILIANDHWLKYADMIPGVLTGKISDFAGMLVAPVLLAALTGVRTRRGLLACHLAVAAVFTGIQLSPAFAALWSALMGVLGHPWVITCDPTDLIALPTLALSWHLLVPVMDGQGAVVGLRRSAVATASVVGLWSTVATSEDPGSFDPGFGDTDGGDWGETEGEPGGWEDIQGTIYIHNPNDFDLALHIRELRPEVEFDCDAIGEDPGRLLPEQAFGPAQHWSLPPTTNIGVSVPSCSAIWVGGEGIEDQIIFLDSSDDATSRSFPGSHEDVTEVSDRGAVIYMDAEGSRWAGLVSLRHSPRTDDLPQPEGCEASEDERRLAWSSLPSARYEILAIDEGVDGCHEIELIDLEKIANEDGESERWYLCVPAELQPLEVDRQYGISAHGDDRSALVDITLLDPTTLDPAVDSAGQLAMLARFGRGRSELAGFADGLTIEAATTSDANLGGCPWIVERDGCALVDQLAVVRTDAGDELEPGLTTVFEESSRRHQLFLGRARSLALVDETCASGSPWLPWDIDLAIVTRSTL